MRSACRPPSGGAGLPAGRAGRSCGLRVARCLGAQSAGWCEASSRTRMGCPSPAPGCVASVSPSPFEGVAFPPRKCFLYLLLPPSSALALPGHRSSAWHRGWCVFSFKLILWDVFSSLMLAGQVPPQDSGYRCPAACRGRWRGPAPQPPPPGGEAADFSGTRLGSASMCPAACPVSPPPYLSSSAGDAAPSLRQGQP